MLELAAPLDDDVRVPPAEQQVGGCGSGLVGLLVRRPAAVGLLGGRRLERPLRATRGPRSVGRRRPREG